MDQHCCISHLTSLSADSIPVDLRFTAGDFAQLVHLSLAPRDDHKLTPENFQAICNLTHPTSLELLSAGPWQGDDVAPQMPDCFTQLQHLHCLKLFNVSLDNQILSKMARLQSLHGSQAYSTTPAALDLSGCSQLTHLLLYRGIGTEVPIFLPSGPYVRLRHLEVDTIEPIHNLKFATALTLMELQSCQV